MSGYSRLPKIDQLKQQAKRLRAKLADDGDTAHSRSLELLAHQHGYKDWNTLHAAAGNQPPCPVMPGQTVCGEYLGQAFKGEVLGVINLPTTGRFRVTIMFDEPMDVVTFDSFSNLRQRVSGNIDHDGKTFEKISNGKPQMKLQL